MEEIWKEYVRNRNYEVSNLGRVKTRLRSTRYKPGDILNPKEITTKKKYTYLAHFLTGGEKSRWYYLHIMVAEMFVNNPDNKPEVNHIDGIKKNCWASNLEWATHQENIMKGHENGQWPVVRGEKHWRFGKKVGKESKKLMSSAKIGKNHPKYRGCYFVDGRKYYSAREAGKDFGLSATQVIKRVKSDKKKYVGFQFFEDPNREM